MAHCSNFMAPSCPEFDGAKQHNANKKAASVRKQNAERAKYKDGNMTTYDATSFLSRIDNREVPTCIGRDTREASRFPLLSLEWVNISQTNDYDSYLNLTQRVRGVRVQNVRYPVRYFSCIRF